MDEVTRRVVWLESTEELYERYRAERDRERRRRLQALWLVRSGVRVQEAAKQVGVGRRSLTRWLSWYREHGLDEVLRRVPGKGSPGVHSRLSERQQAELLAKWRAGTFHSYGEARQWVEQEFGVRYSYHGIYDLLNRLQPRQRKPRLRRPGLTQPSHKHGDRDPPWQGNRQARRANYVLDRAQLTGSDEYPAGVPL